MASGDASFAATSRPSKRSDAVPRAGRLEPVHFAVVPWAVMPGCDGCVSATRALMSSYGQEPGQPLEPFSPVSWLKLWRCRQCSTAWNLILEPRDGYCLAADPVPDAWWPALAVQGDLAAVLELASSQKPPQAVIAGYLRNARYDLTAAAEALVTAMSSSPLTFERAQVLLDWLLRVLENGLARQRRGGEDRIVLERPARLAYLAERTDLYELRDQPRVAQLALRERLDAVLHLGFQSHFVEPGLLDLLVIPQPARKRLVALHLGEQKRDELLIAWVRQEARALDGSRTLGHRRRAVTGLAELRSPLTSRIASNFRIKADARAAAEEVVAALDRCVDAASPDDELWGETKVQPAFSATPIGRSEWQNWRLLLTSLKAR